jgi:hypothetical protein
MMAELEQTGGLSLQHGPALRGKKTFLISYGDILMTPLRKWRCIRGTVGYLGGNFSQSSPGACLGVSSGVLTYGAVQQGFSYR